MEPHSAGAQSARNRLSVDIGGTFTDVVLECGPRPATNGGTAAGGSGGPSGPGGATLHTLKVLTTHDAPERAVLGGTLDVLAAAGVAPSAIGVFVHGTTLATNAIIERKGAPAALIATEGFRDILDIADESRYNQFDIFLDRQRALVERHLRFTVPERVDARGDILLPLDETAVRRVAAGIARLGIKSVAVCLMHAYAAPAHERRIGEILSETVPGISVSLSSEVSPEIREYERTSTTVANAYVQPLMASYLGRLGEDFRTHGFQCPIYLMTSGGGLTTLETARRFPIRLVESGPAGGAILASRLAASHGIARALSFDMGGTTAKICLIDNFEPETSRVFEVDRRDRFMKGSGFPLRIPVIEMVEIGAGGGSIARVDALGRIAVGPTSAGSEPGPACYGRGGAAPTVTDADVVLGRIDPATFAAGRLPLDRARAHAAIDATLGTALGVTGAEAAHAIAEVVDETMANAARVHAVERGKSIADYTLIAFGGAAPLHAARLAGKLGVRRIVIPENAGVGSAIGFLRAPVAFEVVRSRYMRWAEFDAAAAAAILADMRAEAHAVVAPGAAGAPLIERTSAFMRYIGQGHEIVVALPAGPMAGAVARELRSAFERAYERLFTRIIPGAGIEILTWTLSLGTAAESDPSYLPAPANLRRVRAEPCGTRAVFDIGLGALIDVPVHARSALAAGATIAGPAIITEDETTTFVSAGFDAQINAHGSIVLDRKP